MGIKDLVKPFGTQSFFVGVGVAALAYFIGPQLKAALRPTAVKGAQGMMALGSKTMEMYENGKEKISGMMSSGEKVVNEELNNQGKILKDLLDERESSNRILEELMKSINSLKEEISSIKNSGNVQEE